MRDKKTFIVSPKKNSQQVKRSDFISVALLGENHGHRMKSYGPISLVNINGKPLIDRQIEAIKNTFDNFEIILCAGFESYKIATYVRSRFKGLNVRIVENQMHFNTNCCESARLCLNNTMNNQVLFCGGGVLISSSHLQGINLDLNTVLVQENNPHDSFDIGVVENDSNLETLSIGVKSKFWGEIFYLSGSKAVEYMLSILANPDYKNRFMFEAINEFSRKFKVCTLEPGKPLVKLDNIKTLKRMYE